MAAEKMVRVNLRHSVGLRGGLLYGPGKGVEVPESLARAIGAKPVAAEAPAQLEAEELPTIANLATYIADLDAEEVKALQERDDRKTADPIYVRRLAELEGE